MPSPFPGMDPYLESRYEWHGFHTHFIAHLADEMNVLLPADYAARIEERLVIEEEEREIRADFAVSLSPAAERPHSEGSVAILERKQLIDTPQIIRTQHERQRFVEIVSLRGKRQVVTVIELLSPSNKRGDGRQEYQEKQRAVLSSRINLLEIDLLRVGRPTVALPYERLSPESRLLPYVVSLNRVALPDLNEYWPFGLRDRLPRVAVPLLEDEEDIPLDLQAVFTTTYDRGRYAQQLDYAGEVVPPLSAADAEWVNALF